MRTTRVSCAIDEKWIVPEGMMRQRGGCIGIFVVLLVILISCSPSKITIPAEDHGSQSAWTVPPTYTYYPTYTVPPTTVQEITKVVVITETDTSTPVYSPTMTPTKTRPGVLIQGSGKLIAYNNQDSVPMSFFDLDTGKNEDSEASDIEFTYYCDELNKCYASLEPINGAIGFVFGTPEPEFEDCSENMFSELFELPFRYLCFKTSSNNISMFKITLYCEKAYESAVVSFWYKTWRLS